MLFGGIGYTVPNALAVDGTYVYVAGATNSPAITTAQGKAAPVNYIYGTVHKADDRVDHRAFLAKFSLQLTTLDEVTLLGSQDDTGAFGLFVDAGGSTYLTGTTSGPGFPTTNGAFQTPSAGRSDVFVTRLDYFGSLSGTYGPVYSARFGGSDIDQAGAIAVNAAGAAWITGKTCSADFPLTPGLSHGTPGIDASFACTAFLTELDPTGSTYQYSIAFGGSKLSGADPTEVNDMGLALVLDGTNGVYVGGETRSLNFFTVGAPGHPPVEAVAPCNHSVSDDPPAYCITIGFVTYVDAGFNIKYSTYLGGVYSSVVRSLARNSRGDIYAAGTIYANTVGFPGTTLLTLNPTGGFVSKLSSTLDTVNWTQLLGATVNAVVARNPTALTTYIATAGERYPTAGRTDAFMVQMSDVIAVTVPPGPGCGIRCVTK